MNGAVIRSKVNRAPSHLRHLRNMTNLFAHKWITWNAILWLKRIGTDSGPGLRGQTVWPVCHTDTIHIVIEYLLFKCCWYTRKLFDIIYESFFFEVWTFTLSHIAIWNDKCIVLCEWLSSFVNICTRIDLIFGLSYARIDKKWEMYGCDSENVCVWPIDVIFFRFSAITDNAMMITLIWWAAESILNVDVDSKTKLRSRCPAVKENNEEIYISNCFAWLNLLYTIL